MSRKNRRKKLRLKREKRGSCPRAKVNKRTGTRTKYLGHRVRDIGRAGLDSPKEFRGIMRAILHDYRKGCISKSKARGRLLLLYRLTFPEKNSKVRKLSPSTLARLRREIKEAMRRI